MRYRMLFLLLPLLLSLGCPPGAQIRPRWMDYSNADTLRSLAATDARAQRDLGLRLLLEEGDGDAGFEALEEAARREASDPLTWLGIAAFNRERGRRDQSMRNMGRAIEAAVAVRERPDWCVSPGLQPTPNAEECRVLAESIEEAIARLLRETNLAGRAELISGLLEQHESQLGFAAAHTLHRALEWEARRAGNGEEAASQLLASGAQLRWRVAGPFGPFPSQSFDVAHPPESDSRLAESYDLGPGRGEQPTWEPELSACSVQLRSPINQTGTWYAEAAVQAEETGPAVVRLWAPSDAAVSVDIGNVEVIRRDGRLDFEPQVSIGEIHLEAGRTLRIRVKIGSESRDPAFNLSLRDAGGNVLRQLDPATAEWGGGARAIEFADPFETMTPRPGEAVSGLRAFVVALFARARSHWTIADEVLHRVDEPAPLVLLLRASTSAATPTVPTSIQEDRMLSDMRDAFEGDPALWRARLVLARQLLSEDAGRDAMDLLQAGLEGHEDLAPLWHELGILARRLGLHTMAEDAFGRALEHDERSCLSLRYLALMFDDVGLTREREEALDRLVACDATTETRADIMARTYRPGGALEELRRLQQVVEYPAGYDEDVANLSLSMGRVEEAAEVIERLSERWPRSMSYVLPLADIAGATGGEDAILERLLPAIERYPWEAGALRRGAAIVGAEREMEGWRVDGLEHVRRYLESGVVYDSPSVYILDRAVYRIFPDMSSLELVHQVTQVLTQEAIGALSEFTTPRGGEVLTLRTIKADGTILEPLSYDPEGTTNLAGVEVGDIVEWEYIVTRGPSRVYPGGLQTPRFYFATADTAMHMSDLTVLVPDGVDVDFVPRGPSPPQPQPVSSGELRGFRFTAERVHSQVREPAMPSINEVFPSIGTVARENSRSLVQSWSDGLIPAMRADWRVRNLVRELRRPGQTEVQLARELYDYVLDHVRHGRGGTPATYTLATGQGDAMLLYVSLLRVAGFEPDIVYAWSLSDDRSGDYLVPGELDHALLRVTLDDEEWWLDIGSRHAPFGYIPAALRGQPGLTADFAATEARLPEESRLDDSVEITIDGSIELDGSLVFQVREQFTGARATEFRGQINRVPEAERSLRAMAILGRQFSGGRASDVEFTGVDDRHVPMALAANVRSTMLGRSEGSDIFIPARLGEGMRYSALAQLSERRTDLVFDEDLHEIVEQRIRVPEGAQIVGLCPESTGEHGTASFSISCTQEGNTLIQRVEIDLPPRRIAPEDYSSFADFLRRFDEGCANESRIVLP